MPAPSHLWYQTEKETSRLDYFQFLRSTWDVWNWIEFSRRFFPGVGPNWDARAENNIARVDKVNPVSLGYPQLAFDSDRLYSQSNLWLYCCCVTIVTSCNTLQHTKRTATHCNALLHTATHCSALQHTKQPVEVMLLCHACHGLLCCHGHAQRVAVSRVALFHGH